MWEAILAYFGDTITAQKILEVFYYLEQEGDRVMNDRLLSDWEIAKILPQDGECAVCAEIATTQDLKTSQWWVEKMEKIITITHVTQRYHRWEQLKKEVGL